MDAARYEDAAGLRNWWTTAPQLDEHALRDGVLGLVHKIYEASVYDDWDVMQDYIRLYQLGQQYCTEEPYLSQYEYGQMAVWGYIADHYITLGDYQSAIQHLQKIDNLHRDRLARYELQGVQPRYASEMRLHLLSALSTIKWVDEQWRDAILSPEQILDEIERVAGRILSFVKDNPGSHRNVKHLFEFLALTELKCCKLALRYCPSRVSEQVAGFNQRHGDHLALPIGHYKGVDHASGQHSAYYWDFELAKLRVSTDWPKDDVYMLIELRAAAAHDTFGDWPIQGLLRHWRREALLMIRELRLRDADAS